MSMIVEKTVEEVIGEVVKYDVERNDFVVLLYKEMEELPVENSIGIEYRISREFFKYSDEFFICDGIESEEVVYKEEKYLCKNCGNQPLFQSDSEPYCPVCGEPKESNAPNCS